MIKQIILILIVYGTSNLIVYLISSENKQLKNYIIESDKIIEDLQQRLRNNGLDDGIGQNINKKGTVSKSKYRAV